MLRVRETDEPRPFVAHVTGLGTPAQLGFVVVDGYRHYRLREGRLYELAGEAPACRERFAAVEGGRVCGLSEREALAWLAKNR